MSELELLNAELNRALRTIAGWFKGPRKIGIVIVDPDDPDATIVCGNVGSADFEFAASMWATGPTEPGQVHIVDVPAAG